MIRIHPMGLTLRKAGFRIWPYGSLRAAYTSNYRSLSKSDFHNLSVLSSGHPEKHLGLVTAKNHQAHVRLGLASESICAQTRHAHSVSWSPGVLSDRDRQVSALATKYRILRKARLHMCTRWHTGNTVYFLFTR